MESASNSAATCRAEPSGDGCRLIVGGDWTSGAPLPAWTPPALAAGARIVVEARDLGKWDASLVLFLGAIRRDCARRHWSLAAEGLPRGIPARLLEPQHGARAPRPPLVVRWTTDLGTGSIKAWQDLVDFAHFLGDCTIAAVRVVRSTAKFRWRDTFTQMQLCGVEGVAIVSLVSFLVGVILAYLAANILRQFGADIYVADFVGVAVLREMGPIMAAVVLAGRTGAAFAAELGNMKANEEIDALETLGLNPIQFLVVPRLLALQLMMPLLSLYASALGIVGGAVIARLLLDIPPVAYWIELKSMVDHSDLASGLLKSAVFGLVIGIAGCLRGLQAERSATGVGRAATSAVVTSILFVIVADAIFAVLFNILGI